MKQLKKVWKERLKTRNKKINNCVANLPQNTSDKNELMMMMKFDGD